MGSRAVITLNPVEKNYVLTAINSYKKMVEPSRVFCFEVVERKLEQATGDRIELDGMELICMAQAVRRYSKEDKQQHERLSMLADRIEKIRVIFHMMHAKRIKKAARVATLTAIQN